MSLQHSPKIVTDGLVLCVDPANVKGYAVGNTTVADLTSVSGEGTISGSTFDAGSFRYSGSNEINFPSFNQVFTSATITTWIYRNGTQPNDGSGVNGVIFHRDVPANTRANGMHIYLNSSTGNTELAYHWNDGGNTTYNFRSGLVIPNQRWTFCAIAISPTAATLYVNMSGSTNTVSHIASTLSNLTLGGDPFNRPTPDRHFSGSIAATAIYNRTLSQDEILQTFNATRGRFGL